MTYNMNFYDCAQQNQTTCLLVLLRRLFFIKSLLLRIAHSLISKKSRSQCIYQYNTMCKNAVNP